MTQHTTSINQYTLSLQVTREDDDTYSASSPEWSECYAQGDTVEEAIYEAKQVAISLIELYEEEHLIVPLRKISSTTLSRPLKVDVDLYSAYYA